MVYMAYSKNPHLPRVRREAVYLVKQKGWSTREVSRYTGHSQSAIVKWCTKDPTGGFRNIPTESSRPKKSPRALPRKVVDAIIQKRVGTRRCGQVIHRALMNDGVTVSLPSVQRTLSRARLTKLRSPWKRRHDATSRPVAEAPGILLQSDTIHIWLPDGTKLYIYTLIDLFSRWAYAETSLRLRAYISAAFIQRAQRHAPFTFQMIQTDHGTEFSTRFTHLLARHSLSHRHARVRQSNDNAHIERFNRTLQEECVDHVTHTKKDISKAIRIYLRFYNTERLHMGIDFKTPSQMLH